MADSRDSDASNSFDITKYGREHLVPIIVVLAIVLVTIYSLATRHTIHLYQVIMFAVLIPSIILHEISHGLMAFIFGDDTAKRAGRLTLNPLKHIDPIGSIVLPVILTISGAGYFGWAKPVPVNISKLRRPRNQSVLVGLIGPFTNIVIASVMAVLFWVYASPLLIAQMKFAQGNMLPASIFLQFVYLAGFVNVALAIFNLIPIPPLDGSAIVERLLPAKWLPQYYRIRSFMIVAVLVMAVAGRSILGRIFLDGLKLWIGFIPSK